MAGRQADLVAELVASLLRGDGAREVAALVEALDQEYSNGTSKILGRVIEVRLRSLLEMLSLPVHDARAIPPGGLGDVEMTMTDGSTAWIEVKSQSTKPRFADLTQADWVRDETDALRKLAIVDPSFRSKLSDPTGEALTMIDGGRSLSGWSFEDLWLADVGLVYSGPRRAMASIHGPADLPGFLSRKYLLHLTMEGARAIRLDRIAAVEEVISGSSLHRCINSGRASDAIVWLSTEGQPARGTMDFIYTVGNVQSDGGVLGRHKMNARAIARSTAVVIA